MAESTAKKLSEYKNQLTLDGKLKLPPSVTGPKVAKIKELVEATMHGDRIAKGHIEELLTSSDAIFAYAHLTNVNFLPQFERADRTWELIATKREVPDFRPPVLYSIVTDWANLGAEGSNPSSVSPNLLSGVAPIVPEGAPYPFAYMNGEEAASGRIVKRGFKTDFTFEAFINDAIGFIAALPGEMLRVSLDTQEYEVYGALINGVTSTQQVQAGTTPDGSAVTINPIVSRSALILAIQQLGLRFINGRQVKLSGGFNLIVSIGQAIYVQYVLRQTFAAMQDGSIALTIEGYDPLAGITVIESEYVTGAAWYLIPTPGSSARPILDHATLVGHPTPELRVEETTGSYIGGAVVSPFEGNFQNDSATFRLRQIGGGILWTPNLVVWSTGAGV